MARCWQKSTYKLCGDGDRHEESHTISHYNCFICVIVMSLFSTSKLLVGRKLISQRRSSRSPRQVLHHHKLDILGSGLMKLRCYQFFPIRWV